MSEPSGPASESIGSCHAGDVREAVRNGRGKNYRAGSAVAARHIRSRFPAAAPVPDPGCGTGGHLAHVAEVSGQARGTDLSHGMPDVACVVGVKQKGE